MWGFCLKATPCLFIIPCFYHSFIEAFMELLHELEKYRFFSLFCIETGSGALINHMIALMLQCSKSCVWKQKWKFFIITQLCLFFFLTFCYSCLTFIIEEFILLMSYLYYWGIYRSITKWVQNILIFSLYWGCWWGVK